MADQKEYGLKGTSADVELGKGGRRIIDDGSSRVQVKAPDGSTDALLTVADAATAADAVNLRIAEAIRDGREPKDACDLATAASIASWTPSGAGVGKTLTSPTTALSNNDFDGVTATVGDRILVTMGPAAKDNGVYVMTTLADGASQAAVLTRATDADQDSNAAGADEVRPGMLVLVLRGDALAGTLWAVLGAGPITTDTDAINFSRVNFDDPGVRVATLGTGATQSIGSVLPAGARVDTVRLRITTPYSGGATIEIRDDGPTTYMPTSDNSPQDTTGVLYLTQTNGFAVAAGTRQLQAIVGGSPGAGAAQVVVHYTR